MVNLLKRMVESLNTRKVRRTAARWLAVLVVFATTYSLVLPAITMSTTLKGELDGVEVKVEAGKGVLESGTELVLKNVLLPDDEVVTLSAESGEEQQDEDVIQLTQEELDKILEAAVDGNPDLVGKIIKVLDISLDHRGDEIEPNGLVKLHVSSDLIRDAQQPTLVHLDDEGNATLIATKFNKDEGTLAEEGDEEPDEDEDLPSVDSEGYLLDENGERVTDEDGNYTQYEVDEDGSLVLDEDGNPILVVPTEDEETEDKDGEESEKPADGEESEDKDTEESEKPADGEETKDEESEEPSESQKPEQPTESQKPEESEQPSESQKPEASEQPSVSQKPEASEEPTESQKPEASEQPSESQKPADPEPTPETPAAPEQPADPDPEPVPETPAAPEQPAAPEVTVSDEDTALASAPASWGDDDPAATEDKTLVGMTDGFSIYAIVDVAEKEEEAEEQHYIQLPEGYEIPEDYDQKFICEDTEKNFSVAVYARKEAELGDAQLVAEVLEENSDAYIAAADALANQAAEYDGMTALDIHFEDEEGIVEPAEPVFVVINALDLLPEEADPDTVAIQHHSVDEEEAVNVEPMAGSEDGNGLVDLNTDVGMAAAFEVSKFSTFTVTYNKVHVVEETYTVSSRYYQAVFDVNYRGELSEDDELSFTARTVGQEEMESDRDYEYISLIPDSKILPMGRTEFALTKNGEPVDRSEFTVSVKVIPSREAVAFLAMNQDGASDNMMLDLSDEEAAGENAAPTVIPGFTLYELAEGELVPTGHADVDLESLDLDAYMAEAYVLDENGDPIVDEEGNPVPAYDEAYAVEAEAKGEDFMVAAGVNEDVLSELAEYDQKFYDKRVKIWWDGYKSIDPVWKRYGNNSSSQDRFQQIYDRETNHHVQSVTLSHSNSNGVIDATAVTVNQGNSSNPGTENGITIGSVYTKATTYNKDYAVLEIVPEPGYYVESIRIPCAHDYNSYYGWVTCPAYECGIMAKGGEFWADFDISTDGVKLTVPSDVFAHQSYVGDDTWRYRNCFILIRTAPVPSPLFVQYIPGKIGNTDVTTTNVAFNGADWLSGGRTTETNHIYHDERVDEIYKQDNAWQPGDLIYTTAGISEAAKAAALAEGYTFAGWQLEYFNEASNSSGTAGYWKVTPTPYTRGNYDLCKGHYYGGSHESSNCIKVDGTWYKPSDNGDYYIEWVGGSATGKVEDVIVPPDRFNNIELTGPYGSTFGDVGELTQINLITNAKLTAIWVPNPQLNVTKTVENMTHETTGWYLPKTYSFKIERTDGTPVTGYTVIETYEVNGNIRHKETPGTGDTFTLTVTGNRSSNIRIKGLEEGVEYKITETETQGARPSYTVDGAAGNTFTAKSVKETSVALTVTNDFAAPKTVTVRFVKTDGTLTAQTGHGLAGAEFKLYDKDPTKGNSVTPIYTGTSGIDGLVAWTKVGETGEPGKTDLIVPMDATYWVEETKAPDGYMAMNEIVSIHFTDGKLVLLPESIRGVKDETGATVVVNPTGTGAENDPYVICIPNNPGTILPSTGGPGTAQFVAFGVALMAAASLVLVLEILKRRGRARA